jgi:uncharacterized membrane protein
MASDGGMRLQFAHRLILGFAAMLAAAATPQAQNDPVRPKLIQVNDPAVAPRPTMAPVPDEAEPPPKPKLIRVRPQKPKQTPPRAPAAAAPAAAAPAAAAAEEAAPATEASEPVAAEPGARQGRGSAPAAQSNPPPPTVSEATSAPDPASGDENYEYCNRTSFAINVSIGILDEKKAQWRTRGWWTITPGDCKPIIKGKLNPTAYFTFARTHFVHQGPMRMWGGSHTLCVGRGQFQASSDGTGICAPGLEAQGFARIDTKGRPSWRTTLVESDSIKSNDQARIAGLQRLLSDLSIYAGPADGNASAGFRQALSDARAKYGYPATEEPAQTYVKLMAEAAKLQSQTGLTFCNRSASAIWVALGLDEEGRKQSRGWWRIQTGQCEKVVKDRLTQRFLFAHASNDKGGADGAWSGRYPFCTRDAAFEMEGGENCESRGGERTGFFAIDTQGRPGAVYNFNPKSSRSGLQ